MKKYLGEFMSKDFYKFILTGGFAAIVNFIARILLNHIMSFVWAVFSAYIIGMVVAFVLSRMIVFQQSIGKASKQFIYFTIVNIIAVMQTVVVSVLLADYVFPYIGLWNHREAIAHAVGMGIPILSSFLGHKYITFART